MRIVVTLTTIPSREDAVLRTIRSLRVNSIWPNVIYVNLRKLVIRMNQEFSPGFRQRLIEAGATVNDCDDYGSLTKIIPTIAAEGDPEALIVTVDDDILYEPRFIEGLVEGHRMLSGSVVGYSGLAYPDTSIRHYNGRLEYLCFQHHGAHAEILESGFGVIMKRKWLDRFPVIPPETDESDPHLYICDDYVLSMYFDAVGITKRVVRLPWIGRIGSDWSSLCTFMEASNSDSLSNGSSSIVNYYRAMATVKAFFAKASFSEG
jgi:hypothetical protein